MTVKTLRAAFPHTLPVLAGYLALGLAFGILMDSIGISAIWTALSSLFVFAGSAQMLSVSLLRAAAPLAEVFLLTLVLNFRHLFYGLSLIGPYRRAGWRKPYLIFGLTDETYAILTSVPPPPGCDPQDFFFAVTLLNQSYWVLGSVLGTLLGALIPFSTGGVDFAMTALFVVLLVEKTRDRAQLLPAALGGGISLLWLLLLGPDRFLIPALLSITGALLLLRPRLEGGEEVSPP